MFECSSHPRVQICQTSDLASRPALLRRLRRAGASVEVVGCLDQCTLCQHSAGALLSGRYVYGPTPEELCEIILGQLEQVEPTAPGRL